MAKVIFVCDGCGKQAEGSWNRMGDAFKPHSWFQRSDEDGVQMACSRECIEKIAKDTGKTPCVLPI